MSSLIFCGKVCINAGHGPRESGRYDPGALGKSGLQEAVVNQEVAALAAKTLRDAGWNTLLVHDGDLKEVVRQCNAFKADYFISIHCNAFGNPAANGVETYAYKPGGKGQIIARSIQTELAAATGLKNRGVKYAEFYVLKYTICPAVLAEIGFITNPKEEKLMMAPAFRDQAAQAICRGFLKAVDSMAR